MSLTKNPSYEVGVVIDPRQSIELPSEKEDNRQIVVSLVERLNEISRGLVVCKGIIIPERISDNEVGLFVKEHGVPLYFGTLTFERSHYSSIDEKTVVLETSKVLELKDYETLKNILEGKEDLEKEQKDDDKEPLLTLDPITEIKVTLEIELQINQPNRCKISSKYRHHGRGLKGLRVQDLLPPESFLSDVIKEQYQKHRKEQRKRFYTAAYD